MASNPRDISRSEFVRGVDHVIQSRETKKVLGLVDLSWRHPLDDSDDDQRNFDNAVQSSIAVAGWAPFHHSRKAMCVTNESEIHEPWRFYHLDRAACRTLLSKIDDVLDSDVKRGKIPGLLAGAGALVQVTWLPEAASEDSAKLELRNQEHLAAAAAAVQNLLLAAEARGMATYWSSGGLLRHDRIYELLGISVSEKLLASVFLSPALENFAGKVEANPGALRSLRAAPEKWCRTVKF